MARILFATFGSLGDLHPPLALALELQRRGHRCEIATLEGYREKIAALGLPFHSLRPALAMHDPEVVRRIVDSPRAPQRLLRDLLLADIRAMHADLFAAARGADLLVTSELVYAAPLVSEQLGLPWASYVLAPLSYLSRHDPPLLPVPWSGTRGMRCPRRLFPALLALGRLATRSWWRPVRALRRELGLRPVHDPLFAEKHSPRLDLALFSPVLQTPQPDWPRQTVQTGFCFFDETNARAELPAAVERFLAAGDPPVVFTLGSSAVFAAGKFYAECARAAAMLGRRALLLIGHNPPPADLPATALAWNYLPYAAVFPRAAAVVHSGGVGTTAQVLRAGKPMLVVPFAFDQFDNAARGTRLGVGRTLSRDRYRASAAARELRVLLGEPATAATATRLATRVGAERGVDSACDLLERELPPR